jgi:hypothetical protein
VAWALMLARGMAAVLIVVGLILMKFSTGA